MFDFSIRHARRFAASATVSLACGAACAEGTHLGEMGPDPLTEGGTAAGGSDAATAGMSGGGSAHEPLAGTPSTGGSALGGKGGSASSAGAGGGSAGKSGGGTGGGGGAGTGGSKGGMGGSSAGTGGNSGGTGGGMGGMGGSVGSTPTYRYAKLVAISEVTGAVWSSVAELQIMTTGDTAISRTNWVITADSQELDDEMDGASQAIDGDSATFWHTAWEPPPNNVNDPTLPHYLSVDMGTARVITGFSYLPRQDRANGRIEDWEFYVSKDGTTWGTAIKTGTFSNVATLQTVVF